MKSPEKVKDPIISRCVNEKLSNMGIRAPCRVTVASSDGNVTLSGTIQYEHQRQMAMHASRGVAGVKRVVDQMRVIPNGERWKTNTEKTNYER